MEFSHVLHLCLQGGGVVVNGASVSIVNSQIYSNTAVQAVRAAVTFTSSHRPHGGLTFLLVVCRVVVSLSGEAQ